MKIFIQQSRNKMHIEKLSISNEDDQEGSEQSLESED